MTLVGLKNFRTYLTNPDSEDGLFRFRFERGVNLLKGGSGAGKSTLFTAIFWCLFKKPGTGNTPLYKTGGKQDCVVLFEVEGEIRVVRKTPGSLLTVTLLDEPGHPLLENEEAQNFIYRKYGRENVWKTCNYVQQGSTNPMISGELSDSQRWDVLYGITIDTDPQNKVTIDRLKNFLKVKRDELDRNHILAEGEGKAVAQSREREEGKGAEIREELEVWVRKFPLLPQFSPKEFHGIITMLRRVSTARTRGGDSLRSSEKRMEAQIEELESQIRDVRDEIQREEERRKTISSRNKGGLRDIISEIIDLQTTAKRLDKLVSRREEALRLIRGIPDRGSTAVFNALRDIRSGSVNEFRDKVSRLVRGVGWLRGVLGTYSMEELNTPREEIHDMLQKAILFKEYGDSLESGCVFDCPSCKESLRIKTGAWSGKIVHVERHQPQTFEVKKPVSYYTTLLQNSDRWNSEPEKLRNTILELVNEGGDLDTPNFRKFVSEDWSEIPSLEVLWEGCNLQNRDDLNNRISELELRKRALETEHDQIADTVEKLNGKWMNMREERTRLSSAIERVREELREEEEIEEIWKTMALYGISRGETDPVVLIRSMERRMELEGKTRDIDATLDEIGKREGEIKSRIGSIMKDMNSVTRLHEEVERVESDILLESIGRTETLSNEFLENCFDHPIILGLGTERESKTGKQRKHTFHISVKSARGEGNLIDRSLDGFSGGETDRLSLAFSSAISSFSPFPLLLLDECISSLDSDMKDRTIRALRQHAKKTNKAVVLVCHDAVEGLFDHVCQLD